MLVDDDERTRPLAELVRDKHDNGAFSYREMAEKARKRGHNISHSQLQAYATDLVRKAPSPEQIAALAAALDVSAERVRAAMIAQYYGYVPRELNNLGGSGKLSASVPPDLTPEEEDELARMVAAWVAARRNE